MRSEAFILEVEKSTSTYDFHVLGLPFGGPHYGRDLHKKYFSPSTHFGIEKGHMLPTLYNHGKDEKFNYEMRPEFLGKSEYMGLREDGGWFMTRISKTARRAEALYQAGREKILRASTGLAGTLQRWLPNGMYTMWVPGEMTFIDKGDGKMAVNDFAIATPVLKTIYLENGLEWQEVVEEQPQTIEPKAKRIILPTKIVRLE